ncbi:MAG: hypothetical protein RQ867_08975, partial [Mariprofundaceae bacterium]|nr:hypothetical protein [Mariprofundaceae bacterium]
SLTMEVSRKKGVLGNSICQAVWSKAFDIGKRVRRAEASVFKEPAYREISEQSANFESKVVNFILSGAKILD